MILVAFVYLIGAIGVAAYIHLDGNPLEEAIPLGLAWPFLPFIGAMIGILLAFRRVDQWMDKR